jgi:prevent-host-death family protein
MSIFTIHQAKTNLSRLIEKASEGEEVIIARGSKPVARVVPVGEVKGKRQPGSLKGKLRVGPEFFEPLPVRALLDTHALLWWLSDDPALPRAARKVIAETKNTLIVSAASAWEIATKVRLGRLPTAIDLAADFPGLVEREGFELLAISAEHGIRAGLLPGPHKDPFDRMLIAQAQAENIPIVSNEISFESYGVRRLW